MELRRKFLISLSLEKDLFAVATVTNTIICIMYASGSQIVRRDALVRRLKSRRASHSHSVRNYSLISKEQKILMQKPQFCNFKQT